LWPWLPRLCAFPPPWHRLRPWPRLASPNHLPITDPPEPPTAVQIDIPTKTRARQSMRQHAYLSSVIIPAVVGTGGYGLAMGMDINTHTHTQPIPAYLMGIPIVEHYWFSFPSLIFVICNEKKCFQQNSKSKTCAKLIMSLPRTIIIGPYNSIKNPRTAAIRSVNPSAGVIPISSL
jgi:hypothetical protein